jgi:hypothetical protein
MAVKYDPILGAVRDKDEADLSPIKDYVDEEIQKIMPLIYAGL